MSFFIRQTGVRLSKILRHQLPAVLAAVLMFWATACEQKSPSPILPAIQFPQVSPINLNVAKLEIRERYAPPLKKPNVEHLFTTPPAKVIRQWASEKLRAVGSSGTAILTINTAAVTEQDLKVKKGFKGLITRDQAKRYVANISVGLTAHSANGARRASAKGKLQLSETAPENFSLNDRERLFHRMSQEIANNFDGIMRAAIKRHMVDFIR